MTCRLEIGDTAGWKPALLDLVGHVLCMDTLLPASRLRLTPIRRAGRKKPEIRGPNQQTSSKKALIGTGTLRISSLGFLSSSVIRHSDFPVGCHLIVTRLPLSF